MVSGWNLTFAAIVIVAVMLNANARVFLVCLSGAALMSWCLVSLTLPVGIFLLDECGLGASLGHWGDDLFVALLDWDRYTLAGGALLGMIVGAVLAYIARRRTLALDETLILLDDDLWLSPETNWRERTFARLILGRTSPAACQPAVRQARLLRPGGLIAAGVLTFSSLYLAWWISPQILAGKLMDQLALINEAEVSASDVRLSLGDGRLEIDNLEVADPNEPGRDRLRAARVSGRMRMGALWRGRLDVDTLRLEVVRGGVGHATNGLTSLFPTSESLTVLAPVEADHDPVTEKLALADWLADWQTYRTQLGQLQHLIRQIETLAERQNLSHKANGTATGLAGLIERRAMRSPLANSQPAIVIEHLRAEGLSPEWGVGRNAFVEMTNLSNEVSHSETAATLEIVIPSTSTEISANLNLRQPNGKHEVAFTSYDVKLDELLEPRQDTGTFIPQTGTVMVKGDGWVDNQQLALGLDIEIEGLKAFLAGNRPVAGLTPQLWNDSLAKIDRLQVAARLEGPWDSPRLELDGGQIVSELKRQLLINGEYRLVAAVESQLADPLGHEVASEDGQNRIAPQSSGIDAAVQRDRALPEVRSSGKYPPPSSADEQFGNVASRHEHGKFEATQDRQRSQIPLAASPIARRSTSRDSKGVTLLPGPIDMRTGYDKDFDHRLAASKTQDAAETPASIVNDRIPGQFSLAARFLHRGSDTTAPNEQDADAALALDRPVVTAPTVRSNVAKAPPIEKNTREVTPARPTTVVVPPIEQNVVAARQFERNIVATPPAERFASTAPAVERRTIMTPPIRQNTAAAPPRERNAMASPSIERFSVAAPRREQNAMTPPPVEQFAVAAPPIERPAATAPPIERRTAVAPPMEQNAVAVPPFERNTVATPPIELNAIAKWPSEQNYVGTPPNERDTIAAVSSNQQNVLATPPIQRNTIVTGPAERNRIAISSNGDNTAARTPIQRNNIATPPVDRNAIAATSDQQRTVPRPPLERNYVAAPRVGQNTTAVRPENRYQMATQPIHRNAIAAPTQVQTTPSDRNSRIASFRHRLGKRLRGALERNPNDYSADPFQFDANDEPVVASNRPERAVRQRNGRPVIGLGPLSDIIPGQPRRQQTSNVIPPARATDPERVAATMDRRASDPRFSASAPSISAGNVPMQNLPAGRASADVPRTASLPAPEATPPAGVGEPVPRDSLWYERLWR